MQIGSRLSTICRYMNIQFRIIIQSGAGRSRPYIPAGLRPADRSYVQEAEATIQHNRRSHLVRLSDCCVRPRGRLRFDVGHPHRRLQVTTPFILAHRQRTKSS